MAVYLNHFENKTLIEKLEWIYDTYGYHLSNNSYYLSYDITNTRNMFKRLRNFSNLNNDADDIRNYVYPERCGNYKIDKIRDLTVGLVVDFKNGGERSKPKFQSSRSSEMITFYFQNGCIMTLRTSGTEPKIKWYSEIRQLDKSKYNNIKLIDLNFKIYFKN